MKSSANPKFAVFLPHTAQRYQAKRFRKATCPIVERLTCSLMMHGRNSGKKLLAVRIVKHCFELIHLVTDQNPIQVLVDAIINGGPREDSTRIGSAGTVRRQAVDVAPLRRVNQSIYLLVTGVRAFAKCLRGSFECGHHSVCCEKRMRSAASRATTRAVARYLTPRLPQSATFLLYQAREASFRNIKTIAECLADELINAAKVRGLLARTCFLPECTFAYLCVLIR